jgi:gamma-glutamyltranspeptidase/glutathione hydrolase
MVFSERGSAPVTYDGRETAPLAVSGDLFMVNGKQMAFSDAQPGGKSVGVPGNLRMIALAHKEHGKLEWAKLFEPAIRLARGGFRMTERLHDSLNSNKDTGAFSAQGRALFYGPDGNALPAGTLVRNLAFADFLERVAKEGADAFYAGSNARAIASATVTSPHNPSLMTAADVSRYQAKERPPVCGSYRGYRICGMGPSSSGGTTVFAILKQLERFDMKALGKDSPIAWHVFAESQRLAFADRERYLGDDDFVQVPVKGLIDADYLAARSKLISPDTTLASVAAGTPPGGSTVAEADGDEPPEHGTTHFVAVDRWGDGVSYTSTVEGPFGSGMMVGGYFLNNELTDFSFSPQIDGKPVANRVEAGKRPRSSMSPTVVYGPDGKLDLVIGAAGGATNPVQVAKALNGWIDWGLSAQQAIALPVLNSPGDTVIVEQGTPLEAMIPQLKALGHANVTARYLPIKGNAIERGPNGWVGAADPRSDGVALSQ